MDMTSQFSKRAELMLESRSLGDLGIPSLPLTLFDLTWLAHFFTFLKLF
jgi:hypothetical protein